MLENWYKNARICKDTSKTHKRKTPLLMKAVGQIPCCWCQPLPRYVWVSEVRYCVPWSITAGKTPYSEGSGTIRWIVRVEYLRSMLLLATFVQCTIRQVQKVQNTWGTTCAVQEIWERQWALIKIGLNRWD